MWQISRFRALNLRLKIGDKMLILCLCCISVLSWSLLNRGHTRAKCCFVSVDGRDTYKLLLCDSQKVQVSGPLGESVIEVSENGVRMLSSPCPLEVCVHTGWIRRPGQMIVCVPNRIIVRIAGASEVDAVTW
jgi:hypothetical protein